MQNIFLKVTLMLGHLVVTCIIALSQNDSLTLSEVVVIDKHAPKIFRETGRVLKTITDKEIKNMPVQSINELLETALSIDVRQRGLQGVQADISMRGGSFEQTMIMLNGIKINDPQTGHHNLDLPVDLTQVERIEILEGSGARVYGQNAYAGAINIITNSNCETGAKVNASGGQFGLLNTGIQASLCSGSFKGSLCFNHKSSDGYIKNTDFKSNNIYLTSSINTKNALIDFQTGYTDKGFGAQSFYTPKYANQFEKTRVKFVSLSLKSGTKSSCEIKTSFRRHHDRFELFRDSAPIWYKAHNYHMTDVFSVSGNVSHYWLWFKTTLGAEFQIDNLKSNVLGKPLGDSLSAPGEKFGYFTHGAKRKTNSFYIDQRIDYKNLSVSAGTLTSFYSDFNNALFSGVDISILINNHLSVYSSVNQSFRIPTYTELYYSSPTNIGNPLLKPENAITYEIGFKYKNDGVDFHSGYFYRKGTNIIDWVKSDSHQEKWQTMNYTELNTFGIELSGIVKLKSYFSNQPFNYIRADYAWTESDKTSGDMFSYYVLDFLKHKFSTTVNFNVTKRFNFTIQTHIQHRNGTYTKWDYNTSMWAGEVEYNPFLTIDIRASYAIKYIDLFIEGNNLTNVKVIDYGNIPQAGLWLQCGIFLKIPYKRA